MIHRDYRSARVPFTNGYKEKSRTIPKATPITPQQNFNYDKTSRKGSMSARNLLRNIFRHEPRVKIGEDAMPTTSRPRATFTTTTTNIQTATEQTATACESPVSNKSDPHKFLKHHRDCSSPLESPSNMPKPFRLSGIAEEEPANDLPAGDDNLSPKETASLADAFASLDLDISTFSTRGLVNAALEEAKRADDAHLDSIDTTLALLKVLDGFSKTIEVLREEMLEKKRSCEDRVRMLHAVERAVEKLLFTDEEGEGSIEDESADFEDAAGTERSITPTASRW